MREEIEVRELREADWPRIHAVQYATYGEDATPDAVYRWWSRGLESEALAGCVAVLDNRIVGVQPMQVFGYREGEARCKGAMLTGVAVHPDFRRQGIFSRMIEFCETQAWTRGADFVVTLPNERSKPGFLKREYLDLGRRRLWVRPVLFPTQRGCGQIQEVSEVSPAWADVFEAYSMSHGRRTLARSREWLEWRYLLSPRKSQYRLFEAHAASGALEGVAVVTLDTRGRIPVWYLLDFGCREHGAGKRLLRGVLAEVGAAKGRLLAAVCSSPDVGWLLKSVGWIPVPFWLPLKAFHTVVRFSPDSLSASRWQQIDRWEWHLGDWDNL